MPTLIINRDSGYANSLASYKLLLDGIQIGKIASGESKSFEVTPGEHTIQAKINWCTTTTESFIADVNETAFEVFSQLRGFRILGAIFAIFIPHSYIGIRRSEPVLRDQTHPENDGEQDVVPNG